MFKVLDLYTNALRKRPKTTNAIMTGVLFGLGDVSAQLMFSYPNDSKHTPLSHGETLDDIAKSKGWVYDVPRTLRAVSYGALIFSFIGDKWYKILNFKVKLKGKPSSDWSNRLLRVGVDQLLFAPLSLPFYFSCMTIMEGGNWGTIKNKLKNQWWSTLVTNWAVWPLFQSINFSFVPLQHQLLAVNTVAIFWNTYLSYKNATFSMEPHHMIVD
ncbi:ethanol metabolism protein KNAG_0D02610 [Huiozyma naganishii CBS 8797]|uniref:Protein SYM1 n=1 Tax=Huiozyma naganishii (strain ATCC MYA-139 / BCRC 22969 / CBS 8797 / KCTC 17520 / NBRC 10181 / NCYC 3082 / Yp74L-3) TaxID=1071383 RepID=J7R5A2_HUIN7|nr:hypothetical protein KNAG_0D02610 [Kazachstania naganishii CBS 8797]CCK70010.1 hypothetical protein KNAG_0D02610 [Kazachstania naganishii CBS 8797]